MCLLLYRTRGAYPPPCARKAGTLVDFFFSEKGGLEVGVLDGRDMEGGREGGLVRLCCFKVCVCVCEREREGKKGVGIGDVEWLVFFFFWGER